MYSEVKKLHLIEKLLKVTDDSILKKIEGMLLDAPSKDQPEKKSISDFIGSIPKEDLDQMERDINEHCRQISQDDWK
jgi:hypothetical protein